MCNYLMFNRQCLFSLGHDETVSLQCEHMALVAVNFVRASRICFRDLDGYEVEVLYELPTPVDPPARQVHTTNEEVDFVFRAKRF